MIGISPGLEGCHLWAPSPVSWWPGWLFLPDGSQGLKEWESGTGSCKGGGRISTSPITLLQDKDRLPGL